MGYALVNEDPDNIVVWCYCCEKFTTHYTFHPETFNEPTYYECNTCGCVLDDSDDEIIYPDNKTT